MPMRRVDASHGLGPAAHGLGQGADVAQPHTALRQPVADEAPAQVGAKHPVGTQAIA